MTDPKKYALNLLKMRDRSVKEIQDKMRGKKYSASEIDETISFLKKAEFLDDKKFAEKYVRSRIKFASEGRVLIKMKLYKFGISDEIISTQIENISDQDELIRAGELAEKWLLKNRGLSKDKIYRRLGGYLQRKGYSWNIVSEVLDDVLK